MPCTNAKYLTSLNYSYYFPIFSKDYEFREKLRAFSLPNALKVVELGFKSIVLSWHQYWPLFIVVRAQKLLTYKWSTILPYTSQTPPLMRILPLLFLSSDLGNVEGKEKNILAWVWEKCFRVWSKGNGRIVVWGVTGWRRKQESTLWFLKNSKNDFGFSWDCFWLPDYVSSRYIP